MATVMPEGEAIRKAVKWISATHQDKPDVSLNKLINEAVMKFDLSPLDAEFLQGFFKEELRTSLSAENNRAMPEREVLPFISGIGLDFDQENRGKTFLLVQTESSPSVFRLFQSISAF